jgi:hypothetical protein
MRRLVPVSLILVSLFAAAAAFAQPAAMAPAKLTWLRYYQAQPGKDQELTRLLIGGSKPIFDKLMADKKIVGWGLAVPITHSDDPWTHVFYVTVADWSGAEQLVQAVEASDAAMPKAEMDRMNQMFLAAYRPEMTRDVILRHLSQSEAPPMAMPKYIGVDTYVMKQGRDGDAVALFNEWARPLFGSVAAKGKVGPWGLSTQDQTGAWTHMVWYFMSDLAALNELEAASMALEPMKLRGYDVRLRDMSEPEKHRMQILRLVHVAM